MKFEDFYRLIEQHSESGGIIVFNDKSITRRFWTSPYRRYQLIPYIGSSDMTIAIKPSDEGDYLYRDDFLGFLDSLQCPPKLKTQLAIFMPNGEWRGYLTDNLWSHMEPGSKINTFDLDNPWNPNDDSFFGIKIDPACGVINGGG